MRFFRIQRSWEGPRDVRVLLQDFRDTIDSCGLIDPGYSRDIFTWCDGHVTRHHIWERLDRFFINVEML